MHLVFLNQYYPPDAAPTGVMLQAVAVECARQGHEVTVICADGGYAGEVKLKAESRDQDPESRVQSERGTGAASSGDSKVSFSVQHSLLTIHRLSATRFGRGTLVGKLMDYASYYLGVAWRLGTMNPPPDRIVALTTPPYLSVLARAVSKWRGADHAHWVMDLYPDVMVAHGMLAKSGWKHRLLAGLARWGFGGHRCAALLTLGPDMAERLGRYREEVGGPGARAGSQTELEIHSAPRFGSSNAAGDPCDGDNRVATLDPIQNAKIKIQNCSPLISWVPLWGAGDSPGPRVSSLAEPMEVECAARENPVASSAGTSFTAHWPGESGDSRPGAAARRSLRNHRGWRDDELVVMYSGNMGLGHRFSEILEVAGARVSSPAQPMESEREFPGEPVLTSPGSAFAVHRPGESGDSRSDGAQPMESERECPGEPVASSPGSAFAVHRPGESGDSRSDGAQPMESERECPGEPVVTSPGSAFAAHRPGESGDSRSGGAPSSTVQSQRFVFYGGGKRRREIEAFMAAHPEAPVELHDYAPAEELAAHLMTADVHLVSLEPVWTGTMVPSKLQGIFAVGRPVVFIGSAASSIGRWVEESGGGWVVVPGDVEGLRVALAEACDPAVRRSRGEAAARFSGECFHRKTNVKRVVAALAGDSRSRKH